MNGRVKISQKLTEIEHFLCNKKFWSFKGEYIFVQVKNWLFYLKLTIPEQCSVSLLKYKYQKLIVSTEMYSFEFMPC